MTLETLLQDQFTLADALFALGGVLVLIVALDFCLFKAGTVSREMLTADVRPAAFDLAYERYCDFVGVEPDRHISEFQAALRAGTQAEDFTGSAAGEDFTRTVAATSTAIGYVALGVIGDASRTNFVDKGNVPIENVGLFAGASPESPMPIYAKWSVNLRENTSNTLEGGNPVQRTLLQGDCVAVIAAPALLRGQYWAAVGNCP